jgi:cobalt transporter subunit CbtB
MGGRVSGRNRGVHPPPIALAELWPWVLFAAALVAQIALVWVADGNLIHEFLHDGRHLTAFPCH